MWCSVYSSKSSVENLVNYNRIEMPTELGICKQIYFETGLHYKIQYRTIDLGRLSSNITNYYVS